MPYSSLSLGVTYNVTHICTGGNAIQHLSYMHPFESKKCINVVFAKPKLPVILLLIKLELVENKCDNDNSCWYAEILVRVQMFIMKR